MDLGAGTGVHGEFFQKQGLRVLCVDQSASMVRSCQDKGLQAVQLDFLRLSELDDDFNAAFAMNSLLHVPKDALLPVLRVIHDKLEGDGLFFWGQYGGHEEEGILQEEHYEPKRFFSFLSDEGIQQIASKVFNLLDFHTIRLESETNHFQSLTLRKVGEMG